MNRILFIGRSGQEISLARYRQLALDTAYTCIARTEFLGGVLRTDWIGFDPDSPAAPHATIETAVYLHRSIPVMQVFARSLTDVGALVEHRALAAQLTSFTDRVRLAEALAELDAPPF